MKKIKRIIASLLISISLAGCSVFDKSSSVAHEDSSEPIEFDDHVHHGGFWNGNDTHHWKICEECQEHYCYSEHECTTVRYGDLITYSCYCGFVYQDYYSEYTISSYTIDSSNFNNYGNYDTGNYGNKVVGNWHLEYYRIKSSYGYCFAIKPNFQAGDDTLPGAIYNTAGAGLIYSLVISYDAGADFTVRYGNNANRCLSTTVSAAETNSEILLGKSRFFSIESGAEVACINSITINYIADEHRVLENEEYNGYDYRIGVSKCSNDELIDGESTAIVPTSIRIKGNTFQVLTFKQYTYYSFSYVNQHSEYIEEAAMLTKEDVCNYYLAFHEFPANYATSDTKNMVKSVFGSNTRLVQEFDRTDGYATSVPFNGEPPKYFEFDIALAGLSYSLSNRGVGRVVIWDYGFSCYNDDPVAVYTDDHYHTFQEYLNYGSFGDRFNSEGIRVSHGHKPAKTLRGE